MTGTTDNDPHAILRARLDADRETWRRVVAEVGDRLDEPGPMGEWTFRDLAAHLMGWRERTIRRVEAIADGRPEPPNPWPADLDADDAVNDWIQAQATGRPAAEVLAEMDASFDRLAVAFDRIPAATLTDPNGLYWLDGKSALDVDWFGHWRDEHEPSVRAWLDGRG